MAADPEASSLPPLKPQSGRSRKTNLKSSIFKSTQDLTESQFQREARRLNPRITVLEAQVSALRSEIPVGLSAAFAELKAEIQGLRSAPPDWANAPEVSATDYDELKAELLQKVTAVFTPLEAELNEKIPQVQAHKQARVLRLLPIEDEAAAIETRIADLRRMINLRQRRVLQRLRYIQTAMAQLPQPAASDPVAEVDEIWRALSSHRAKLSGLRDGLQNVRSQIASSVGQMAASNPEVLVRESPSTDSLDGIGYSRVPDLSGDIEKLRDDVLAMQSHFGEQMKELTLKIKENEKAQREGMELIATLGFSLKTMAGKVDQIHAACSKFSAHVNQVAGNVKERSLGVDAQLKQVLAQIHGLNSTIGSGITELRDKLEALRAKAPPAAPAKPADDPATSAAPPVGDVDVGKPVADTGDLGVPSDNPRDIMATVLGSTAGETDAGETEKGSLDRMSHVMQHEEQNDQDPGERDVMSQMLQPGQSANPMGIMSNVGKT